MNPFDHAAYWAGRAFLGLVQRLPLSWVAKVGRAGGALAWWIDARHRKVAINNLTAAFPEKSAQEIHGLASENLRRLGENYTSAIRTSVMTRDQIDAICELTGVEKLLAPHPLDVPGDPPRRIVAIGHFGNFELYSFLSHHVPGYEVATTYRGLPVKGLDRLLMELRARSKGLYFERRTGAMALRSRLAKGGVILGLLSDQHAGDSGLRLPFFGRECSTSAAPALLALRYRAPLFTAACFRIAPGRWRVEVGDAIPTFDAGVARSKEDISMDMNRALEIAVRRDPANWFWVHRRWKPRPPRKAVQAQAPGAATTEDAGA